MRELRALGFEPVYDEAIFDAARFVAGDSRRVRARVLSDAWRDPSIAALIAVRGGYGSAQLLPLLDPARCGPRAKPLIGYSDITALLSLVCRARPGRRFTGRWSRAASSKGPAAYDEDSFRGALIAARAGRGVRARCSSRRCARERRRGRLSAARSRS